MKGLDKLRALSKVVNKSEGAGSMTFGVGTVDCKRITTGSISLDIALGGGMPAGRIILVSGEESSGKTTLAYRTAGHAQELCANCYRIVEFDVVEYDDDEGVIYAQEGHCDCYKKGLITTTQHPDENKADYAARLKAYEKNSYEPFRVALIDIEGSIDRSWAEMLGFDHRLMVYARPPSAEQAIDVHEALLRTGAVDMIIIDSIAALTPRAEIEESVVKLQQGLQARLVNKFMRKTVSSQNDVLRAYGKPVTCLMINQIREKIGVMFGDNRTEPGGRGQKFAASVHMRMWAGQFDKNEVSLPGKEKMGYSTHARFSFKVEKNKTAPPKRTGSFMMAFDTGEIEEVDFIYKLAEQMGEISKEGSKWVLGVKEFPTQKAIKQCLSTPGDPVAAKIREKIIKEYA